MERCRRGALSSILRFVAPLGSPGATMLGSGGGRGRARLGAERPRRVHFAEIEREFPVLPTWNDTQNGPAPILTATTTAFGRRMGSAWRTGDGPSPPRQSPTNHAAPPVAPIAARPTALCVTTRRAESCGWTVRTGAIRCLVVLTTPPVRHLGPQSARQVDHAPPARLRDAEATGLQRCSTHRSARAKGTTARTRRTTRNAAGSPGRANRAVCIARTAAPSTALSWATRWGR